MKKILFQDTSFRDGFQSVFGARVLTKDFLPALEAATHAGIEHIEAGGGARFQAPYLYCNEDAFDMMDTFRKTVGKTVRLQTLARGINVVALGPQPRDMIDLHAKMFKKHGMTRIRNFDALNDVNNLIYSGKCIKDAGLEHEVVITMMELPRGAEGNGAHEPEFYVETLKKILDAGIPYDSICFKDSTGTANPNKVYNTFKLARKLLGDKVELRVHSHDTCANGIRQYVAAIEGGADGICCCRSPLSGGTGQPDLLAMWHTLKGTDYTLDLDVDKILEANNVLKESLADYEFPPEALAISPEVIFSPMPGGALTANTLMMRDTKTFHLYPQVIKNMAKCVALGGFASSVTPVSQYYFQQAYANTVNLNKGKGEWDTITDGYGDMVLGYLGKTPREPDPEIVKIASEKRGKPVFKGDPLDKLEPGIPKAKKLLEENKLPVTDENLFIIGAFDTKGGNKGLDFLLGKPSIRRESVPKKKPIVAAPAVAVAPASVAVAPIANTSVGGAKTVNYGVSVGGKTFSVQVSG
ncbi:oxaloacetate decarboxylase subunit alpha [Fibrobacterales bacterium]|nr:oxaloacetate decarboxylase subunit alpha [Fibrobacterales bacterium]